jgi:putative SOS response-associated peptidase YedK
MCGRFVLHTPPESLAEYFDIDAIPDLAASYNIAPSQPVAAVRVPEQHREMVMLRWGLLPSWAKAAKTNYSMINARAETVAEKPAYRTAFRQRRCLIPADGFYEWKRTADGKQPYYIRMREDRVFAFAGLWERWIGPDEKIDSCSIIVTEANDTIRPVHDRMPAIIRPADFDRWLDPECRDAGAMKALLQPWPANEMTTCPVSKAVNSPVNNDAHCIAPVT